MAPTQALKAKKMDKVFLITTATLVIAGFFIFISASLGLLTRGSARFEAVTFNQVVFGLIGGSIACFITSRINYNFWRKHAFYFFIAAAVVMLLVFVPGIQFCAKGACRWIDAGFTTFQPSEIYKLAFVMYLAAWLASVKSKAATFKLGTLPFLILVAITAAIVLMQPDTDTFMVISLAGLSIFLTAGGRWRDILVMGLVGVLALGMLVMARPYLKQRLMTFMDPARDPTGSGYQIQQSLIAIGSGGVFGRGFGQSIQKFNFLPEPIGDSIFAVAGEEFGFVGTVAIIGLYVTFAIRGYKIALRAPDLFGTFLVVGIVTLIIVQSFLNIAAMLAIIPLAGTPLLFISHGGTALFFALASVGIILNVSRYQKKTA
ncbi:MAG TPA: putative peptidoglycan glycosyltransferase FtsW [Candidatus Paceibacterota bacterium]